MVLAVGPKIAGLLPLNDCLFKTFAQHCGHFTKFSFLMQEENAAWS